MAEELLSLKWNNHQSHFVDILSFLREKDMFVDATIACGGKVYSAHKFVLSTCSDYFKQIFTRNPNSNPIVFMKDVSCRDIEALLDFMYHGEVNVPQSSLGSLIKTAESLQIKGLAVPDDPPASRREQERDKRERDPISSSYLENRSPPPKRRTREKNSPPRRTSNNQSSLGVPSSNRTSTSVSSIDGGGAGGASGATHDDSRVRSSSPSATTDNRLHTNSNSNNNFANNDTTTNSVEDDEGRGDASGGGGGGEDSNGNNMTGISHNLDSSLQPPDTVSPGPSGLTHSKQEEVEIKQEDVVDLGEEDDDGEWGGGGLGDDGGAMEDGGGGGGGNDSLSSADNTVNFSDVLLPHGDSGGGTGDSAMSVHHQSGSAVPLQPSSAHRTFSGTNKQHQDFSVLNKPHHLEQHYKQSCGSFQQTHQKVGTLNRNNENKFIYELNPNLQSLPPLQLGDWSFGGEEMLPGSQFVSNDVNLLQDCNVSFGGDMFVGAAEAYGSLFTRDDADGNSRRFVCPECNKAFKMRHHLVEHSVVHKDEKPFKCPVCPCRFKRSKQTRNHVRVKHMDVDVSGMIFTATPADQDYQ